ncbi:MAG: DUF362 domain-containing protein [Candidatus Aminicenantes bacterium]|nr:DUF362 domain-containing protein [Candidatus Aminicenantes bacterium]
MSKVSIVRCGSYDPGEVRRAVASAVAPLGGMRAFVRPGARVLLKPNLLIPAAPERAITTHPAVVEAVIGLVREAGGEPFIADSPGGPLHNRLGMAALFRHSGLSEVARRTGVRLRAEPDSIQVPTPGGQLLKRLDLLASWREADVVVSLPKLKTHNLTLISGALKNPFGLVPGLAKPGYHAKLADIDQFCDMLLDVVACVRPVLTIMDGVLAMEGDGPSTGGLPRALGLILASPDPTALDAVVCRVIGVDPGGLALFRAAERRGWWPVDIALEGVPLEEAAARNFRLPAARRAARPVRGKRWVSRFMTRALTPRPVPRRDRCTACGDCARMCPRDAIAVAGPAAVVDDERCIRCYCCHEICPEAAVGLRFSPLGRLLRLAGLM